MNFKLKLQKIPWLLFLKSLFFVFILLAVTEIGFRFNQSLHPPQDHLPLGANKDQISLIIIGDSTSFRFSEILKNSLSSKFRVTNLAKPYFHVNDYPLSDMSKHVMNYNPDAAIFMLGPSIVLNNKKTWADSKFNFLNKFYVGRLLLQKLQPVFNSFTNNDEKIKKGRSFDLARDNLDIFLERLNSTPYYRHGFKKDEILKIYNDSKNVTESGDEKRKLTLKFLSLLHFNKIDTARNVLEELKKANEDKITIAQLSESLAESTGDYELAQSIYLDLKNERQEKVACAVLSKELYLKIETDFAFNELKKCLAEGDSLKSGEIYVKLSLLSIKRGDKDAAKKYALKAISMNEQNSSHLWEAYYSYSLMLSNDEKIDYLKKALELNPNNFNMLRNYFLTARLKNKKFVETDINFLKALREQSIYVERIDAYLQRFELKMSDANTQKKALENIRKPRIRFALAMAVGAKDEANQAFLDIEDARLEVIKKHDVDEFKSFYILSKKTKMHLLIMQKPNMKIESLREALGEDPSVTYFDTYSFFRDLVKNKKISVTDLFMEDGNHLTELGSKYLADEILKMLKKEYK